MNKECTNDEMELCLNRPSDTTIGNKSYWEFQDYVIGCEKILNNLYFHKFEKDKETGLLK